MRSDVRRIGPSVSARVLVVGLFTLLLTAACTNGGGDDGTVVEPTPTTDSDGNAAEPAVLEAQVPEGPVDTLAEFEQLWQADRAAVVEKLKADGFGRSDGVLTGPGDFEVELARCPTNLSDDIAAGEPLQIASIASAADFGSVNDGMRAYFDYVNSNGGVRGHQIEFVVLDDQRVPSKSIEALEDVLASSSPLAVSTSGTTSSQAVFDALNRECIPQPFVGSGHPAWGDPEFHPWTTGFQMSYSTEAVLWGSWIKRNLRDDLPVTVAAATIDNDFGRAYLASFQTWATKNPDVVVEVVPAFHAPDSTDVGTAVDELRQSNPAVLLTLTAGAACGAMLQAVDDSSVSESLKATFLTAACSDPNEHLIPAGRAASGVLSVDSPMAATNDPANGQDPFVVFVNQLLADAGIEDETGQAGIGAGQYGWAYVQALQIAAELDGGISRSNLLLALRSLTLSHPLLDSGVSFSANGKDDSFYVEGGRIQRFSVGLGAWEPETLIVDLNGSTPNCAWNGQACS